MDQFNIFDFTRQNLKVDKPIRLIELFAGVGSQAMALRDIGADFEHYKVVEFDKYAIASYNAIHGTEFPITDITEITGSDLEIVDTDKYCYIMTYSFPCTDLSVAGKMLGMKEGSGTRSSLLWEVKRLLEEAEDLPQILLMENVTQVHSQDNMPHFAKWLEFLESKGYSNYIDDLNAKDYGVAQNRDRTFCVSILGEYNYKFPRPIDLRYVMKDYLEDKVDEKYYINSQKAEDLIQKLLDNDTIESGESMTERQKTRCMYCDNLIGKKGALGMCNKHYIQYKRWGDPLHSDKKERATVDGYYRDGKTGRREHRVIYENHYGIKLSETQIIHHINFVKTDNRIENLYLYENASEHIKAHREYERLMENKPENADIFFEDGKYTLRERERERFIPTDRGGLSTLTEPSKECTSSKKPINMSMQNPRTLETASTVTTNIGHRGLSRTFVTASDGVLEKKPVDLSVNEPRETTISNTIMSRQDRGISNHRGIGGGIVEYLPYERQ